MSRITLQWVRIMSKESLVSGIKERTDKQLRTLRNNLNNRISALSGEDNLGRKAKELKASHPLFGLTLNDCRELLELALQEMKARRQA